jgi:hypothetical protein
MINFYNHLYNNYRFYSSIGFQAKSGCRNLGGKAGTGYYRPVAGMTQSGKGPKSSARLSDLADETA